jgi:hypothetical protein
MQLKAVTMGQGAELAWPGLLRKLAKINHKKNGGRKCPDVGEEYWLS